MPHVAALIVAAGSGQRLGGGLPKQYRPIGGKPVLRRAVEAFLGHPRVGEVRVVIGAGQEALAQEALGGCAVGAFILGAEERALSVRNGLEALRGRAERVLIHDAARPFCPPAVIDRLLDALDGHAGAVPVLPVADTLSEVAEDRLGARVDRAEVRRVQTPQAFRLGPLLAAAEAWRGPPPTDESAYLRGAGIPVAAVEGDAMLDKLTTAEDWARAEALLGARALPCTGFGFDVHAFCPGDGLWLGGIRLPHDRSLAGHSDADVALHALTDALLGAIGAGDIGTHFPPSDPQWRGAASASFLEHARSLVEAEGGRIVHCDLTIICEAPRLGPYREAMRARIAELLRLPIQSVSIKATTTERLGFAGRGEGIAAQAVATILRGDFQ